MAGKETFSSPALTLERFWGGQCLLVPSEQLNEHPKSIPSVKQLVVQASMFQNQVCRNDHSGTQQHCIYKYYFTAAEGNFISNASVCSSNQGL